MHRAPCHRLVPAAALALALALATALSACAPTAPTASPAPTATATPTVPPTPKVDPSPTPDPDAPPAAWLDGGIFSDAYDAAYRVLRTMTLEEKVGQVFLAKCPGAAALDAIAAYRPAGFNLFEADFKDRTREQVVAAIASYQSASRIPMAISADEEGGTVIRLSKNPLLAAEPFNSPHWTYDHGGFPAIAADAEKKAQTMLELGLNLNLAPVVDVSTDPLDMMYQRTLERPADLTSEFVALYVERTRKTALSSCLKHFPGYGNNKDTHTGAVVDERPMATFEGSDFLPFEAGIAAGVECVMVSHVIVTCMDPDRPASLSPAVHAILRSRLGFTGLILTDSLGMGAISAYAEGNDPHVAALLAGNDLLVTPLLAQGYAAVLAAVEDGTVPMDTLDHAVFRVLAWKISRGIVADPSALS